MLDKRRISIILHGLGLIFIIDCYQLIGRGTKIIMKKQHPIRNMVVGPTIIIVLSYWYWIKKDFIENQTIKRFHSGTNLIT